MGISGSTLTRHSLSLLLSMIIIDISSYYIRWITMKTSRSASTSPSLPLQSPLTPFRWPFAFILSISRAISTYWFIILHVLFKITHQQKKNSVWSWRLAECRDRKFNSKWRNSSIAWCCLTRIAWNMYTPSPVLLLLSTHILSKATRKRPGYHFYKPNLAHFRKKIWRCWVQNQW